MLLCTLKISAQSIRTTCTTNFNINQAYNAFSTLSVGDSITIYGYKKKSGFFHYNIESENYAGLIRTNNIPFEVTEKELKKLPNALSDEQTEFMKKKKIEVAKRVDEKRKKNAFSGAFRNVVATSYSLKPVNSSLENIQKGDTIYIVGYNKGYTDSQYALFNDKVAGIYKSISFPFTISIVDFSQLPSAEDPDVLLFLEARQKEIIQRKAEEKVRYREKALKGKIIGVLYKGELLENVEEAIRPFEMNDTVTVIGYSYLSGTHYFALYSDEYIGNFRASANLDKIFKYDTNIEFEKMPAYDDPEVKLLLEQQKPVIDSLRSAKRAELIKNYENAATDLIKTYKERAPFFVTVNSWSSNSVGGIEVCLSITNCSTNTIKYVNFQGYFKNAVGDKCYNEIGGGTVWKARGIGPIGPRPTTIDNCMERMYDCEGNYNFDNITFYSRVADTFHLSSVSVEYANGTTVTLSGANLQKHVKYN